jgi:hypothetical protein
MKAANFSNAMSYAARAGRYEARYGDLVETIKGFSGTEVARKLSGIEMIDLLISIIEGGEE